MSVCILSDVFCKVAVRLASQISDRSYGDACWRSGESHIGDGKNSYWLKGIYGSAGPSIVFLYEIKINTRNKDYKKLPSFRI